MNKEDFRILCRDIQIVREATMNRFGGEITEALYELSRMARRHRKLCEDYCNVPDFNSDKIDTQERKMRETVKKLNGFIPTFSVSFQRDPRGLTTMYTIGKARVQFLQ